MSLVGTRPPTVDEYEQYEIGHRKRLVNEYFIRLESECFTELFQLWNGREVKTIIIRRIKLCIRIHSFRINILCKIEKF